MQMPPVMISCKCSEFAEASSLGLLWWILAGLYFCSSTSFQWNAHRQVFSRSAASLVASTVGYGEWKYIRLVFRVRRSELRFEIVLSMPIRWARWKYGGIRENKNWRKTSVLSNWDYVTNSRLAIEKFVNTSFVKYDVIFLSVFYTSKDVFFSSYSREIEKCDVAQEF